MARYPILKDSNLTTLHWVWKQQMDTCKKQYSKCEHEGRLVNEGPEPLSLPVSN